MEATQDACALAGQVVNSAPPGVTEDQQELVFRHLMRCQKCRSTLPAEARGHFVASYVLHREG